MLTLKELWDTLQLSPEGTQRMLDYIDELHKMPVKADSIEQLVADTRLRMGAPAPSRGRVPERFPVLSGGSRNTSG